MKIKTKRGARRIRNQRVITRRFVTTDYTGCSYITAGKRYEVLRNYHNDHNPIIKILDDEGDEILPLFKDSTHLDGNDWQWGVI